LKRKFYNMKHRILLFLFVMISITFHSLILDFRQSHHVFTSRSMVQLVQKELQTFFSSWFWKKVDLYGHFGNWRKQVEKDGQVKYFSSIERQKDVEAMGEISISLDPSFTERVVLIASELALKKNDIEKARKILFHSIVYYPNQEKLYRLYGELGHICYVKLKDYDKAIRYFSKSVEELKKLNPKQYNSEDTFHIRLYGLEAGLSAFHTKDYDLAYQFYKLSGYESGTQEYNQRMEQTAMLFGDFQSMRKKREIVKREKKAEKDFVEGHVGHDHSKGDHESHEGEEEQKDATQEQMIQYNQKMKQKFLSLVPEVNEKVFREISWKSSNSMLFMLITLMFAFNFYLQRQKL
jgi:tetratricopeptide (TPR) repeat protein